MFCLITGNMFKTKRAENIKDLKKKCAWYLTGRVQEGWVA
jgi:hypothetical protein